MGESAPDMTVEPIIATNGQPPSNSDGSAERAQPGSDPDTSAARDRAQVLNGQGWAFDRYELLGRLAYGGMAEVYLAREPIGGEGSSDDLFRPVVIKRILPHVAQEPTFVDLFRDEARIAARLAHAHICHLYSFGTVDGNYYLAMEWIDGHALGRMIRTAAGQARRLPAAVVARIGADIAGALTYAHGIVDESGEALQLVHRDVTPQNIMVGFDGSVKLLDFGVAKAVSRSSKTRTGMVRGKFPYMSPEHCLGKDVDARSDLFSLGICLYEALTGRALYHRESDFETAKAIVHDPVPSIHSVAPEVPLEIGAVVEKALAKKPADRFQTAGEMQHALEEALTRGGLPVHDGTLRELMRDLFEDEIHAGPSLDTDTELLRSLGRRSVAPNTTPTGGQPAAASAALLPAILGGLVVAIVLLGALGAWWNWRAGTDPLAEAREARAGPAEPAPTPPAPTTLSPAPMPEPVEGEDPPTLDPAQTGSLWITSEPPGAQVAINSTPTGTITPVQLSGLWPGNYRITLRLPGKPPHRSRVRIERDRVTQVTASFEEHHGAELDPESESALTRSADPTASEEPEERSPESTPIEAPQLEEPEEPKGSSIIRRNPY